MTSNLLKRAIASIVCLAAFSSLASAQTPGGRQNNSSNNPAATPPKKNERPAVEATVREPFDGATVEKMAAQCVRLETEAGEIQDVARGVKAAPLVA